MVRAVSCIARSHQVDEVEREVRSTGPGQARQLEVAVGCWLACRAESPTRISMEDRQPTRRLHRHHRGLADRPDQHRLWLAVCEGRSAVSRSRHAAAVAVNLARVALVVVFVARACDHTPIRCLRQRDLILSSDLKRFAWTTAQCSSMNQSLHRTQLLYVDVPDLSLA